MQQLPPTPQDQPTPNRVSFLPVVFAVLNAAFAAGVIALGVRYDDQDRMPGPLVWIGVLMILPQWLVFAALRAWQASRNAALRLASELSELSKRHGSTTDVIQVVESMLPDAARKQEDDGRPR